MKLNIQSFLRKSSNVKEAIEKRDTAKLLALGSLGIAILCTVLGAVLSLDILESIGMIVIVVSVLLFILWFSAKKEAARFQNIFCECGEKYLFPDHVTYEVTGEQISSGKNSNNNNVTSHTNTNVAFCCTCPKCGKVHNFNATFVTEKRILNERGVLLTTKSFPLDKQLNDFFNA